MTWTIGATFLFGADPRMATHPLEFHMVGISYTANLASSDALFEDGIDNIGSANWTIWSVAGLPLSPSNFWSASCLSANTWVYWTNFLPASCTTPQRSKSASQPHGAGPMLWRIRRGTGFLARIPVRRRLEWGFYNNTNLGSGIPSR